jgi:hypothetical protein
MSAVDQARDGVVIKVPKAYPEYFGESYKTLKTFVSLWVRSVICSLLGTMICIAITTNITLC